MAAHFSFNLICCFFLLHVQSISSQSFDYLGNYINEGVSSWTNPSVASMTFGEDNNTMYVVGTFTNVAGQFCAGFASYSASSRKWTCLTSSTQGVTSEFINTIYYHPFSKIFLIGGASLFNANGTVCRGLCSFENGTFSSAPTFNDTVSSITGNPNNAEWYACGSFGKVGSLDTNYVVKWNGSMFVTVGAGFNSQCTALAWNSYQGRLYAVGQFTQSGLQPLVSVAYLNSANTWLPPTAFTTTPNSIVSSIFFLNSTFFLIGGSFTNLGSQIALHNGTNYLPFGDLGGGFVRSIVRDSNSGVLYAGGNFFVRGVRTYLATYNGTAWNSIATASFSSDSSIFLTRTMIVNDSDVIFGGSFLNFQVFGSNTDRFCASHIVRYSPTNSNLTPVIQSNFTEVAGGINGQVFTMVPNPTRKYLYVAGALDRFGSFVSGTNSAFLANSTWRNFTWLPPPIASAVWDDNILIVGKQSASGEDVTLLKYNISKGALATFDYYDEVSIPLSGNYLTVMARNTSSGWLYVGGILTQPVQSAGMWNGSAWDSLSNVANKPACNGMVYAIAFDPQNQYAYFGGSFTGCGPINSTDYLPNTGYLARYSPVGGWSALSTTSTVSGNVDTIAISSVTGFLYAGGTFSVSIGMVSYQCIVGYNPANASFFSMDSLNGRVRTLQIDPNTDTVYAGGMFYLRNLETGVPSYGVANYRMNRWIPFANVNGAVHKMMFFENYLYIAGIFSRMNGSPAIGFGRTFVSLPPPTPSPTPSNPTFQPTTTIPTSSTTITTQSTDSGAQITSSSESDSSALIGGVVGAVLALILICVIIFIVLIIVRRKNRRNGAQEFSPSQHQQLETHQQSEYAPAPAKLASVPNDYVTAPQKKSEYESVSAVTNLNTHTNQYATIGSTEKAALSASLKGVEIPYQSLEIVKELGKGNFGVVNLAKYNGKLVAVKQLKEDTGTDAASVSEALKKYSKSMKEFVEEAKLLSKIPASPHVISLIGVCIEPFAILTEYLDGGSLLEYLRKPDEIQMRSLVQFLKEILIGVAHLHKNKIIHRDLAARNVMLRLNAPNSPQCVLTDMGLARLYDRESAYQKTKSATFPLRWSAPELLKDKKSSEKSDIWSWAVVSVEIFSRSIPFQEYSPMEFALAMVAGRFDPSAHSNTPIELKPTINKCFSRSASERPTAQQIIDTWPY